MTHARRRGAHASTRTWRWSATPRARAGSPGSWAAQISEVSDTTTRVLMEAATWVGPNIMRTSKAARPAHRGLARASRSSCTPSTRWRAQRLAARLMVELCGARLVPGHDRRVPAPGRAARRAAARRAHRAAARRGDRRGRARPASSSGSASGWSRRGRRLARDRAVLARQRRAARGRPDRGGRAHPRPRQAADHAARARAGGRPAHAQPAPAPPARGRSARPRPERGRVLQLHRARRRSSGCASAISSRCSDREPAERGPERDAPAAAARAARRRAAQRRARPAGVALFESAHVYLPGWAARTRPPEGSPRRRRARDERHHMAAVLTEAAPGRLAQSERGRADFYAAKALLEALLAAAGVEWSAEPGERPFLHPGRDSATRSLARPSGAASSAGSASCTRSSRARGSSHGPVAAFELDVDALAELAPGASTYSDVTSFPAVLQDIAVIVPDDVPAGGGRGAVRAGRRGPARAHCGSSTSTAASRWARATSRSRCGSSSARPTAR